MRQKPFMTRPLDGIALQTYVRRLNLQKNGSRPVISEGESCRCGKLHLPFTEGATWGAPQATQVADRWHILSNLGDALEEFLIRAQIRPEASGKCQKPDQPLSSFSATPARQRKSQARLATQMETVSEGTGTPCSWDEPAQDRGRTGSRSEYGAQVLPPASRSPVAYPATLACESA
jgi:hypothetical protein